MGKVTVLLRIVAILAIMPLVHYPVFAEQYYYGINLAGGEFNENSLPGTYDQDYTYPNASCMEYYKNKGFKLIRFPFLWERVQPTMNGDLSSTEMARIDTFISNANSKGMMVILDCHNYGRRHVSGTPYIIGTSQVPVATFANFWGRMAARYKNTPGIYAYGIMNEPHDMSTYKWKDTAQAAINAIRAQDTSHIVMVCGDDWGSAARWKTSNANMSTLTDNTNKLIFEAHSYWDDDASGTYNESYDNENAYPDRGIDSVKPFAEWIRDNGKKGFIGEYGVPGNDSRWNTVLNNFMQFVYTNNIGGTYWAGGPWWGNYVLSIEPSGGNKEQMSTLVNYLEGTYSSGGSGLSNLAINKTASANGYISGEEPSKGVDNSTGTKWCYSNAGDKWLAIDLGQTYSISRFIVKHAGANGESSSMNTKDFKFQKSSDGSSWTDIAAVNDNTASFTTNDVTAFNSRYVRLYITNAGCDNAARIYEFEVWGTTSCGFAGVYKLTAQVSGKVLDVPGDSSDENKQIQQWTWNDSSAQKWKIEDAGDGYYKISSKQSSKYLTVSNASTSDGTPIVQATWANADSQKWEILDAGSGKYKFVSKLSSSKVMDVTSSGTNDGVKIHLWTWNNSSAQKWDITYLSAFSTGFPR